MATFRSIEGVAADLDRRFARRMAPLAVAVALVVAFAPPLMYLWAEWRALGDTADRAALRVAESIQSLTVHQPFLWHYNVRKVLSALGGYRSLDNLGQVEILDCAGRPLVDEARLTLGTGHTGGPVGWAPVWDRGEVVAWVRVTMDPGVGRDRALGIVAVSGTLGALIGLLLFLWPVGVVRRQALELHRLIELLRAAEEDLRAINVGLAARVRAAVEEVRSLSERNLSIQEEERSRVARELHDGLGQLLAGLEIDLQLAERDAPDNPNLRSARDLCDQIMRELRRSIRDLQPLELETAGLVEVLRETCERFEIRTGVVTSFRHTGEEEIKPELLSRALLRIVQEALNNVRKHAAATEVGVALKVLPEEIRVEVRDDGAGFDPSAPVGGMGLRSIRERVDYLGGAVHLRSAPDEGTLLIAVIPRPGAQTPPA